MKERRLRCRAIFLAIGAVVLLPLQSAASWGQAWPAKTVQWIVPFAAGGSSDAVVRIVADKLKDRSGQAFAVINRPGANGDLGAEAVASSAPDGFTLMLTLPSIVTNPMYYKASVDPARLAPVVQMTAGGYFLLASPAFPAATAGEILQLIRSQPGKVTCAATGSSGTLGCEMLRYFAKSDMLMVPYKGSAPGLLAAMSGEVDLVFQFSNTAESQVRSGRVRAIAATGPRRGGLPFPELPVMMETIPDFELLGWHGVMVARATPRDLVQRINREFNTVLALPEVKAKFAEGGMSAVGGTPEDFETRLKAEQQRYGHVLREAGVKPE